MENQAVDAVALAGSVAAADFSLWGLFLKADVLVKGVMVMLIVASFWCWAIIFEKGIRFRRLRAQADAFEDSFWSGGSLEDLFDKIGTRPDHPMELLFVSAMREWRRSTSKGLTGEDFLRAGIKDRIAQVMHITLTREIERLERYMGFLATVGSTAPFIGLFGTVWGIMNSFRALGAMNQATLASVAPGIAEALIATAIGLFAAIPAVVAYNRYANDADRLAGRYDTFAEEFSTILQRQAHS